MASTQKPVQTGKKRAKRVSAKAVDLARLEVNRPQLARLLGVHPDTVTDYVRKGMPTITTGGHGRESAYDAFACLDWWRQGQGKNVKDVAQARSYESTAKLNEVKLAEKKGELLPRAQVVAEGQQYTRAWAAQVRGLPRRLEHAGVIERHQVTAVAAACRDLLTDIAGWKTTADLKHAATIKEPAA